MCVYVYSAHTLLLYMHMHTYMYIHMRMHTYKLALVLQTHTLTHTTHTYTHAHTHTQHTHTRTYTHTHTHTQLPEDGGPLTIQWMQSRLEAIGSDRMKILNEKRNDNTNLAKHKESVLSELEKLRTLNRAHRKLMVEIWQHLTALARVRDFLPLPALLSESPKDL